MPAKILKNYINGEWVESKTDDFFEIRNPATDALIAQCPQSTSEEVSLAVGAAQEAFWDWRLTIPTRRAECLYKLRQKVVDSLDELAKIIVYEHGKTFQEAEGELVRSLQYIEHACGIPELMKGDYSEDVGTRVDEYYIREPLGVFVIIPPFSFPAMIALYFVWAVACGNTAVVKPSELCPMTMLRITELAEESGFPKGVLNVLNGGGEVGHQLVTHPDVAGVSLVGSSKVAEKVFRAAAAHGKRAQCQGGAKNHALVMNDARLDKVLPNIVRSCFGNTGQRCFALSNLLVHEEIYDQFKEMFTKAAQEIKLGFGLEEGVTMGPVVSKASLEKLLSYVEGAIQQGARLIFDGRNPKVQRYPDGYFLGPTILEAEPDMTVFREEVFGPVRCLKAVKDMEEAIEIINRDPFGHTAVIYTESGGHAREFIREVNVGQVGINVGTPAPIAFYPVGGRKISFYGSLRGRANDAVDFYTDKKVIVSRWHTAP